MFALYLLNQQIELYQTCTETPLGQEKEVIRFWWPWSNFQGHIGTLNLKFWLHKSLSVSYLLNQMMDSDQASCIVSLVEINNLIGIWWHWHNFQGRHTIKIVKMSVIWSISSEPMHGFWPNQTAKNTLLGRGKQVIRFRWSCQNQGHHAFKTVKMRLVNMFAVYLNSIPMHGLLPNCQNTLLSRGKEVIRFWWPWPNFH